MRLAGDCHDKYVWAVDVVSRAGNDHRRAFLASLLVGERKGDEDDIAKRVCGFCGHLGGVYSESYIASASLSQTVAKLATAA